MIGQYLIEILRYIKMKSHLLKIEPRFCAPGSHQLSYIQQHCPKYISILKCHCYAFSNITFHAVCHVAVCEHNLSVKL